MLDDINNNSDVTVVNEWEIAFDRVEGVVKSISLENLSKQITGFKYRYEKECAEYLGKVLELLLGKIQELKKGVKG